MIDSTSFQNICGQTATGHVLLAKALFDAGHISAAVVHVDQVIEHSPLFGKGYYWKAVLLNLLSRDDEAESYVKRSLELEPDAADGWFALATLQMERGDTASAANSVKRSLALDSMDHRVHHLDGSIALSEGRLDDAIAADRRVLRLSPGSSQNRLRLAVSLQRSGDEPAAVHEVLTCLRMQSIDVNTRICLTNLLLSLGQVDAAIAECHATAQLFPLSPHPCLRLAQIHFDLENDELAIAASEEAIRRVPKHLECEMLLARIRLKQGDAESSIKHVKAVLEIDADLYEAQELLKAAESALAGHQVLSQQI